MDQEVDSRKNLITVLSLLGKYQVRVLGYLMDGCTFKKNLSDEYLNVASR